jgi:hypothetical protein
MTFRSRHSLAAAAMACLSGPIAVAAMTAVSNTRREHDDAALQDKKAGGLFIESGHLPPGAPVALTDTDAKKAALRTTIGGDSTDTGNAGGTEGITAGTLRS